MKTYSCNVAGATYANPDGSSRQSILRDIAAQDSIALELEPEPDNKHDPNAVKVIANGQQIGYVPGYIAKSLAPRLERGGSATVRLKELDVPASRNGVYSMSITINVLEDGVS